MDQALVASRIRLQRRSIIFHSCMSVYSPFTTDSATRAIKDWILEVIFWQWFVGTSIGVVIGYIASKLFRSSETRNYIIDSSFFCLLFPTSYLVCWPWEHTRIPMIAWLDLGQAQPLARMAGSRVKALKTKLPNVLDLLLNSSMLVYFGASIPWHSFTGDLGCGRLVGCLLLILPLQRTPVVLALKKWIPNIKAYSEVLFRGRFGPIGVGALFLAIEARARLETETSRPLPHPPKNSLDKQAIDTVWPVMYFVVLGSVMVHGLSPAILSVVSHFSMHEKESAPLIGEETEHLYGMASDDGRLAHGGPTTGTDNKSDNA